ncbi:hypothetical protein AXG93_4118s1160 [Marchantia polymorpha subsp. ruderalis]|uniref:Uncharacterized protein n=1 Tax=Marchantia polymorpha subsp. ruderalis TaxID=1480154 RepID=A0A176W2J5_MARPO|nr:hypothetical protein AXG93_4118s1160 [Marchantia polymorpha subsp. ruderalis]
MTLDDIIMLVEIWRLLGKAIRDNATMTTVNLWRYSLPILGLEELACATSSDEKDLVLHLKIQPSDYNDVRGFWEEFRDLMALLKVNLTLREIDVSNTPWGKDGKAALIEAALKQYQERAVCMSVFIEAK